MAHEERDCWRCDRGKVLRSSHPMERPTWTKCGHCNGSGTVSVYVYPKRQRRAS